MQIIVIGMSSWCSRVQSICVRLFAHMYRHDRYKQLLSKKNISLSYDNNLVDEVWGDAQVC